MRKRRWVLVCNVKTRVINKSAASSFVQDCCVKLEVYFMRTCVKNGLLIVYLEAFLYGGPLPKIFIFIPFYRKPEKAP